MNKMKMKMKRKTLIPLLLSTLCFSSVGKAEPICVNSAQDRSPLEEIGDLSAALEEDQTADNESLLVLLEDGSEILLSDVAVLENDDAPLSEEDFMAGARKKRHHRSHKKRHKRRYTNRGILGPKGKWPTRKGHCAVLSGKASYYGGGEKLKRHTASGQVFSANRIAAAHRTLPLGAKVEITNVKNGRKIASVVINDRGPAIETRRELDVTRAVAKKLGFIKAGETAVKIKVCR
jgi:rare lipoprotein A